MGILLLLGLFGAVAGLSTLLCWLGEYLEKQEKERLSFSAKVDTITEKEIEDAIRSSIKEFVALLFNEQTQSKEIAPNALNKERQELTREIDKKQKELLALKEANCDLDNDIKHYEKQLSKISLN